MKKGDEKPKKQYEPPQVKEIGGDFEQAFGISNCVAGGAFVSSCSGGGTFGLPCGLGASPSGSGCSVGLSDQACATGGGDTGACSMGTGG
ncbi:MAG: hypothetical protein ACMUIM_02305 [bacterium]